MRQGSPQGSRQVLGPLHPLLPQAGTAPRPRRQPPVRGPGRLPHPQPSRGRPGRRPRPPQPRPRPRSGQAHRQSVPGPLAGPHPRQPARPHRGSLYGPAARLRATPCWRPAAQAAHPAGGPGHLRPAGRRRTPGRQAGRAGPPAHPGRAPLPAPRPGPGGHLAAARPQRRHRRHPTATARTARRWRWPPSRSRYCWTPPTAPPAHGLAPGRCWRRRPGPATANCAGWNGPTWTWTPAPSGSTRPSPSSTRPSCPSPTPSRRPA